MSSETYSLCFMCSVRCPIKVVTNGQKVEWIEGNPFVPGIEGSLCPRGAAGVALLKDAQRLKGPLIRKGPRGANQWRHVTWDEALDYTAGKLQKIIDQYGSRSIVLGERTQLATHVSKTFLRALGSPNHFTHDALCKGSVNTACRSMTGYTDAQLGMDYKNTKHIVFYGRNFFEALEVKGVNNLLKAVEQGAKITYIDPRVTITATKAHRYWMIRPGTDLALNYALIQVILDEGLYDREYAQRWLLGLEELRAFIKPYTPRWAEEETGIPAEEIVALAREVSQVKPAVIFHFGYRGASHTNETYFRRSILIINALLGSIEAPGGLFIKKGPGDAGGKAPRKLTEQEFPHIADPRFDLVGTPDFALPDPNHGVGQRLPMAILDKKPYPLKALIAYRFDPLMSIPDYNLVKQALDELDLIVSIDINFSDIAWYSDVILPESIYLERTDSLQQANGLKPQLFIRQQAVPPLFDTKDGAVILKELGQRLGIGEYFPYQSMEDLVRWQLEGTGFTLEDFLAKGFVSYAKDPIMWDRRDGIKFKTKSGKIELASSLLEDAGFDSFPTYQPIPSPPAGQFRLIVGRCALHTHVSTQNNPYLNELCGDNRLWLNSGPAAELGLADGDWAEVSSSWGKGKIKVLVSDLIHPEAAFMLHGFGHQAPGAIRSFGRGLADGLLMENISDLIGGSPALHNTFVSVRPT
jgi:thiosulfate reductase/polysulfide reductase chain A